MHRPKTLGIPEMEGVEGASGCIPHALHQRGAKSQRADAASPTSQIQDSGFQLPPCPGHIRIASTQGSAGRTEMWGGILVGVSKDTVTSEFWEEDVRQAFSVVFTGKFSINVWRPGGEGVWRGFNNRSALETSFRVPGQTASFSFQLNAPFGRLVGPWAGHEGPGPTAEPGVWTCCSEACSVRDEHTKGRVGCS